MRQQANRTKLATKANRCDGFGPRVTILVDGANAKVINARSHTAAQFRAQFLCDVMRIGAVADNLRTDENN
ncbi:hypothetical protein GGQ85_002732 [Nitrobacter vulgaris]|jgi:hypothetical protein|nr:hypothetical protein [Nitrobacter vulgaris]